MNKDIITQKEAAAEEFFEDFFSGCGGVDLCLWLKHGKKSGTRWKENSQDGRRAAAVEAVKLADQCDVYFGVCPVKDSAAIVRSRGKKARAAVPDVATVPALWADIDLAGEGHKSGKNYAPDIDAWGPTFEALPPSYIIQSGHGLHCYWLLEKPFQIESEEDRERIGETVKRFQSSLAASAGYDIDTTGDLARVLRVPCTVNHKEGAALPVEIIKKTGARYELADLVSFHAGGADQEREPEPLPEELPEALPPARKKKKTLKQALAYCRRGKSAAVFARLYDEGDISEYGNDLSRALQALLNIVSPRCDHDEALTLELVQSSALWGINVDKHGEKDALRRVKLAYKKAVETSIPKAEKKNLTRAGGADAGEDFPKPKKPAFDWPDMMRNWRGDLVVNKNSDRNVRAALNAKGIIIRLNELKNEIEYISMQGGEVMHGEKAIARIRILCQKMGMNISAQDTRQAVGIIAEENKYNPVADYLSAVKAAYQDDGVDYVARMFQRIHLTDDNDIEFCFLLFKKWLVSCVEMAFNQGKTAAQGVLVLAGGQGVGKTRFVKSLSPDPSWVKGGQSINPESKDDLLKAMRFWLAELGEMGQTLRRKNKDALKNYLTENMDAIRRPYGHDVIEVPRRCVFVGTINPEEQNGFLTDETGSRRWWILKVKPKRKDEDGREVDGIDELPEGFPLDKFWAQVMIMAETLPSFLDAEELEHLAKVNLKYDKKSAEELVILDRLNWKLPPECWRWVSAGDLARELDILSSNVGRVGRALVHIAKINKSVKKPTNNRDRRYLLPPIMTEFERQSPPIVENGSYTSGHF